jgi:hypothetical protein
LVSILYLSITLNIFEKDENRNVFLRSILPSFFVVIAISLYLFPKIYYYDKFQKFIQNYYPPRPKQISNSTPSNSTPPQQRRLLQASHQQGTTPPFPIIHQQRTTHSPPSSSSSPAPHPLPLSTSKKPLSTSSVPILQIVTMISEEKLKVPSFSGNMPCQVLRPTVNDESWWGVQYELQLSCSNTGKQGDKEIMTLTMDQLKEELRRLKKNQVGDKSYFLFVLYIMKNYESIRLNMLNFSGRSQQTQQDIFQPASQKIPDWKDFVEYILFGHGILNETSSKRYLRFLPVYNEDKVDHFKYSISEKGSSSSMTMDNQLYLSQDIKDEEIDKICNNLIFEELLKMIQKPN